MTEIKNPIMIVCTGRSGSTMYYRQLARHKDVGWLSTYNEFLPKQIWLSKVSNSYRMKIFDKIKNQKLFPKPFSPYHFWEQFLPGIARHDRPSLSRRRPG